MSEVQGGGGVQRPVRPVQIVLVSYWRRIHGRWL